MATHPSYQHKVTLEVGEYPRELAVIFPELRELAPGEKPLAYSPIDVPETEEPDAGAAAGDTPPAKATKE